MTKTRVLIFGDSLVYGAWDSQGGWCDRLKRRLHKFTLDAQNEVKFQVLNLGIGGNTSQALLTRFESEILARYRPDWPAVIIIAVGANDTRYVEEERPVVLKEVYRQNLKKLIEIARKHTNQILLVGISPVANDIQPFKQTLVSNSLLKAYDEIMSQVAEEVGVQKVSVMEELQAAKLPVHARDGVHLNDAGHEMVESMVWGKVKKLIMAMM